jgi:FKBP-type peptidyl-prolyl cis-trans isomerase SlyD
MKIEKNTVVSVTYDLHAGNETETKEFIEAADASNPLTFLFGSGGMIPAFEENLQGLDTGSSFDFQIASELAYGQFDPEAIVELPMDTFMVDGKVDMDLISIGNTIPMMDDSGNRLTGKVIEVTASEVKMDFNHLLAGKDLHFTGKVIEVRQATAEEIDHGHVHGPGGHHH